MSAITEQDIRTARAIGRGKIDVATLIAILVGRGHSEYEAAEHAIAIGAPADLAYARATEHSARQS